MPAVVAGMAMCASAVIGAATWAAIDRPRSVVLGPAAVARLRQTHPASVLAPLGTPADHEPRALRQRAVQMEATGVDIAVVDLTFGPGVARRLDARGPDPAGLSLEWTQRGSVVRVVDPKKNAIAEALGLQPGDLVLSVDGWPVTLQAMVMLGADRAPTVIEVRRAQTTLILCAAWDGV
jgi:hypothetical protein